MIIRRNYAIISKIFIVIFTPIIIYLQDLIIIFNDSLKNEISTHTLVIPFLLGFMIYRDRKIINVSITNSFNNSDIVNRYVEYVLGLLLCFFSLLIKWFGSYSFNPLEYHLLSMPIFICGIIIIIFNYRTVRSLLFPIFFLVFFIPPPISVAQYMGAVLSTISSNMSYQMLKGLNIPVMLTREYVSPLICLIMNEERVISFNIDIACSGIYSLVGFFVFSIFISYISNGSLLKKLLILLIGFPFIFLWNVFRVTTIVLIGYYLGPNIALNIFHLLGGWIFILIGTLSLFLIGEKILKVNLFKKIPNDCTHIVNNNGYCSGCGKIFAVKTTKLTIYDGFKFLLFILLITSQVFIQVPIFALTRGEPEILTHKTTGVGTTKVLPQLGNYELTFVSRDTAYENISGQDASLIYRYLSLDEYEPPIWVLMEIGPTRVGMHRWESCVITYPSLAGLENVGQQLSLRDVQLNDNPPLFARIFSYKDVELNQTQVIIYWYSQSIFDTEAGYQEKWTKISVIRYLKRSEKYEEIEKELLPIAVTIANYWEPIKKWSSAARFLSENSLFFMPIPIASIVGIGFIYLVNSEKRKYNMRKINRKISDPLAKSIIMSINQLEKEKGNVKSITQKYEEIYGEKIDENTVEKILLEAEKIGIIQKKIIRVNDDPYIHWKMSI